MIPPKGINVQNLETGRMAQYLKKNQFKKTGKRTK